MQLSQNQARAKRKGIFYGWWLVADATIIMGLTGGVYFYGFSAFFTPLINHFGWSRTEISGAISLSRLEGGLISPIVGYLVDRFGPRRLMVIGCTILGVGFFLLSQVNSIVMFYIVVVMFISVGSSLGLAAPANAAVVNWFIRKRGRALGIVACGTGIGGLVVPVLAWWIEQNGWRSGAVAVGILFMAVGIPLALFIRHRPEQYGYLPDGDDPALLETNNHSPAAATDGGAAVAVSSADRPVVKRPEETNFTPRQAIGTRAFWLISIVFALRHLVTQGIGVHLIPALENMGYSPTMAASLLAGMTVISVSGRLFFGWLADRFDKRYVFAACLAMQSLGMLAFANAGGLPFIIFFLLVYSPAYGGTVPLMMAIKGEFFGRMSFATIAGLSQGIQMWGTVLGPLLAGYAFDVSGSYQFAFTSFAIMNFGGFLLLLFFVKRPKLKPTSPPALK